jgi:hypothetical protein
MYSQILKSRETFLVAEYQRYGCMEKTQTPDASFEEARKRKHQQGDVGSL